MSEGKSTEAVEGIKPQPNWAKKPVQPSGSKKGKESDLGHKGIEEIVKQIQQKHNATLVNVKSEVNFPTGGALETPQPGNEMNNPQSPDNISKYVAVLEARLRKLPAELKLSAQQTLYITLLELEAKHQSRTEIEERLTLHHLRGRRSSPPRRSQLPSMPRPILEPPNPQSTPPIVIPHIYRYPYPPPHEIRIHLHPPCPNHPRARDN